MASWYASPITSIREAGMDLSVDSRSLRSGGQSIDRIGAGAEGDLRRLHSETATGVRAAWGTDVGPGAVYEELAMVTGEALDLIGAALAKSGADTQRMADAYEHADGTAHDVFGRIGRSA
jgi:hypothetical protein